MKAYLLSVWDTVRTSYWFVPAVCITITVILSVLLPMLDEQMDQADKLPGWLQTTTPTARATLSALAGSMFAVTGTVFSITIVTLSLTSQQFGPRLLRRFMYDLATQMTLGIFLSTGFYCLLILRIVKASDQSSAPHLSVFAAVLLGVISMAMLIVFIHHIAMLIQAPHVVAAVSQDLNDAILQLFPEKLGEAVKEAPKPDEDELTGECLRVSCGHEGYVQGIDSEGLFALASHHDSVILLQKRPGDFVFKDCVLAHVYHTEEMDEETCKEVTDRLNDTFIVGRRRTPRQDIGCAIEELVELAVRSLSPGINDAFTANNCIDYLGAALIQLANRQPPSAYRFDEENRLRVIAEGMRFPEASHVAFDQIRHYAANSPRVLARLVDTLTTLRERTGREQDQQAVSEQLALARAAVRALAPAEQS